MGSANLNETLQAYIYLNTDDWKIATQIHSAAQVLSWNCAAVGIGSILHNLSYINKGGRLYAGHGIGNGSLCTFYACIILSALLF
jgi:hypothetical protein